MTNPFVFNIPLTARDPMQLNLFIGSVLYVLGANGAGKSSLVSRLFSQNQGQAKRISAHRQTWFESNTLDMTARNRQDIENNVRAQDAQPKSRYYEWNPSGRAGLAIYDLIDADTMQERKIAGLVRSSSIEEAVAEALIPSPVQQINELMRLSNLPIEIVVEEGQKILARKSGGASYSIAELSDGERNAFLIAADVLTAKSGLLILIDEPERHLHRSIISPLLKLLFDRRKDCAFIVSTHEIMLPIDNPSSTTLLVRSCEYQGQDVQSWTADLVEPGGAIDDEIKGDILGSRRKMIFVEGNSQSLDAPLYSLLFPEVSIIPKKSCRDVENAVRGLREAADITWISVWGIVDSDQRDADDIARLKQAGVWAIPYYSVESFYYHPTVVNHLAVRLSAVTGDDAPMLVASSMASAIDAVAESRSHLIESAVLRSARNKIFGVLPKKAEIVGVETLSFEIGIAGLRQAEEARFDQLVASADWVGLLARYPLRETSALNRIVAGLKFKDKSGYEGSVLKLLQDDQSAVADLREMLGDLYTNVSA